MKKKVSGGDAPFSLVIRFGDTLSDVLRHPQKMIGGILLYLVVVLPGLFQGGAAPLPLVGTLLINTLYFYLFFFCLCGVRSTGKTLELNEFYLLTVLAALYFITAHLIDNEAFFNGAMPISAVLPTALIMLLSTIMVEAHHARIMSMLLPLGVYLVNSFDVWSFGFALASGVSAAFVLHNAKQRIDMVKAGWLLGIVHFLSMLAILLIRSTPVNLYAPILSCVVLNGIASGMLVLGITPLLEKLLHSATSFRLIELLDLDAPLMRQLASKTPGTYNHSLVVANLAEAACQEIGARALLGRVGAYYHDIGKMDQPEYFVENQHDANKHDDINPRLSATVIRSHVKVGIEKGRAAGLPNDVIDIIASHHGNSLIAYFYNEALKREENADKEDFCYPGHPPRTKEAAVVMLADVTEAAVRTLDKPSTSRIEKFINDLITRKIDSNQLVEAELTFRELETIKKVFVRVLASYYHTRIEYPNQQKENAKDVA